MDTTSYIDATAHLKRLEKSCFWFGKNLSFTTISLTNTDPPCDHKCDLFFPQKEKWPPGKSTEKHSNLQKSVKKIDKIVNDNLVDREQITVEPRYSAPAFNIILPIKHMNFSPKKHFHSYFHVGNSENLALKYNFGQSLEMRYSGVQLYRK